MASKKCEVKDLSSQLIHPCQRWNPKNNVPSISGFWLWWLHVASCPLFFPNTPKKGCKKIQESTSTSDLIWLQAANHHQLPTTSELLLALWVFFRRRAVDPNCVKPAEVAGISSRAGPLPPILGWRDEREKRNGGCLGCSVVGFLLISF